MHEPTLTESAAAPAALAAFLRGVERRGAVFAELQCGDAGHGDGALAAAMRAFREGAVHIAVSDWPRRFWSLLLAAPALRRPALQAQWPAELEALAHLGSGPRAALLLRLVAGMQEAEAAAVLGVAQPAYRLALQQALPRRADGGADEPAWAATAEAIQQSIRQLSPLRLAQLAQLREAALQPRRSPRRTPRSRPAPSTARPRWLLSSLWAGVVACALAFAASFVLPALLRQHAGEARIERVALPPAAPASTFDAQTALLTDRDFDMLQAADESAARDLALHSWYAAQQTAAEHPQVQIAVGNVDDAPSAAGHLESIDAPR